MSQNQTKSEYQTKWNLGLLYDSPDDPQIKKDLETYDKKRKQFAEKYENRTDYLKDEDALLAALKKYEQLLNELQGAKPLMYFHYLTSIKSSNNQAQAKLNKITTELTKAQNQLTFFPIKLGTIDEAYQQKFLSSDQLSKYHYLLKHRFELAKFDLKQEQEKIINLTNQTSHQMWTKGVQKALNQKTVKFKREELPLSAATQKIPNLPTHQRQKLHQKVLAKATELKNFAESEINAIVTHKHIEDELRGHQEPYQATILKSENQTEIVLNLVELITKNFDIAHQFYQLKARLLKTDQLTYADRAAKLDRFDRHYSYQQAYQAVKDTFDELDPRFGQIFKSMAQRGQIDVFPKKGKVGGAFCSSSTNNPTYILLNHTNDFNSVTTLAHEMGHAIHSELSKSQPVIYQSYSTSTAETASTFFEQFVFEHLIEDFSQEEKVVALHNKIQDDINTIFRQVALFNFELELHQAVKETGYLSSHNIGQLLNKHMQSYLGKQFNLTNLDGNFYILWPHIRYFFYTYTYAYGHLISKGMVRRTKKDPKFVEKIKKFLSAGGSASPKNIFSSINIDIADPNFFQEGLKEINADIDQLEAMMRR